ncbi:MAG: hypothetical protein CL878_10920 [Dehalococcoidia bacterium]|nr:hypothetical protein [Dehalococcoidia bacterium]
MARHPPEADLRPEHGEQITMGDLSIEFTARGRAGLSNLDAPTAPAPSEILTRTRYSGVTNGTERHGLMNDSGRMLYPARVGYQHVSVVEAVGSEVEEYDEGDVVFIGNHGGHRGWHLIDLAASNERQRLCIKLPSDVEQEWCALLGITGVGMRHSRRIRIGPGQNVWVAGLGPAGQAVAQAARAFGAYVTVTDVNQRRLDVAQELGAHRVINVAEPEGKQLLKEGGPYDRIVDACGVPSFFLDIHRDRLLARHGVVGALAVRQEATFHHGMLHSLTASIESSSHFTLEDLRILLQFVRLGTIRIEPIVSRRLPVTEAPRIYDIMRDRPGDLLGVIFNWGP